MKIPVVVDCRSGWIIRYHFRLRRFGLDRAEEKKYRGMVSERKLEHIKEYCREKHLKYYIDNAYGTRDSGYRERFLKSYHPLFGKIYLVNILMVLYVMAISKILKENHILI